MTFVLVLFKEKNELAVVPMTWLKGKFCVWPNCKNKDVKKYVMAETSPGQDWSWHEIKIFGVYDTYEDAKKHERKAEDTSNIDTDPEMLGRGHRVRKRVGNEQRGTGMINFSSSSDDEERPSKRLNFPAVPEIHENEKEEEEDLLTTSYLLSQVNDTPTQDFVVLAANVSSPVGHVEGSSEPEQSKSRNEENKSSANFTNSRLLKDVLHMKLTLREHGEMLQSILYAVNTLVERGTTQGPGNSRLNESFLVPLPMRTLEDVHKLEEQLVNEELQEHLCSVIAQVGGVNIGNFVRRIMNKLLTNEVAMCFSWLGAKEKRPFVSLRLSKIILDAVRRNALYETVSDSVVESVIKDWLRHAKARSKSKE